jgi:DNA-binding transcriptional regulator YiaG
MWGASTIWHFFSARHCHILGAAMPRKNPLPERELQVCRRVRSIRATLKRSRVDFGREINLDSSTLSNLEHGRIRLRFYIAKRLGEQWGVSLRWLAEKKGPMWGYQPLHEFMSNDQRPFTEVYDQVVKPELEQRLHLKSEFSDWHVYLSHVLPIGAPPEDRMLHNIIHELRMEVRAVPPDLRAGFKAAVVQSAKEFVAEHLSANKGVDNISESVNIPGVTLQMPRLLDRLKRATVQRGSKSALAKFLRVPLASVSQWLSGDREPGGETTLRLLNWVRQEEAKQKEGPDSATNTSRAKTQVKSSHHDNQTKVCKKK